MKKANGMYFFFAERDMFSNWYPSAFEADGKKYQHVEQYMMERKALLFGDIEIAEKIMNSNAPVTAKALGRKVRGYKEEVWKENREEIVFQGLMAKFSSNDLLKNALLETENAPLVEASPYDAIWGIKLPMNHPDSLDPKKWRGLNLLGKVLEKTRQSLQPNAQPNAHLNIQPKASRNIKLR